MEYIGDFGADQERADIAKGLRDSFRQTDQIIPTNRRNFDGIRIMEVENVTLHICGN